MAKYLVCGMTVRAPFFYSLFVFYPLFVYHSNFQASGLAERGYQRRTAFCLLTYESIDTRRRISQVPGPYRHYEIIKKGRRCLRLFGELEDDLWPTK